MHTKLLSIFRYRQNVAANSFVLARVAIVVAEDK
jgi:hypothetical protein